MVLRHAERVQKPAVAREVVAGRLGAAEGQAVVGEIANYEDRFVIPTARRETGEDAYQLRGSCGFSFGEGCSGKTGFNLFGARSGAKTPMEVE